MGLLFFLSILSLLEDDGNIRIFFVGNAQIMSLICDCSRQRDQGDLTFGLFVFLFFLVNDLINIKIIFKCIFLSRIPPSIAVQYFDPGVINTLN